MAKFRGDCLDQPPCGDFFCLPERLCKLTMNIADQYGFRHSRDAVLSCRVLGAGAPGHGMTACLPDFIVEGYESPAHSPISQ
jgi:hypothetical protein